MSASSSAAGSDPNVHHLAKTITCHAWNADRTKLAFCPNDNTVEIWSYDGSNWEKEDILTEHDQLVTGVDWAPNTNRLVTCSEDRNAYVWTRKEEGWKPTLVILRINRAATHVKWSPLEDKFAVSSGAKVVSVCYFEEDNDWWVSKHIKKHKSTVLFVDWHPNNFLLVTGCADFKARIFSALVKGVDKKPKELPMGLTLEQCAFGECLMEIDSAQSWVHCVRFSPSGQMVAFVGHDATISFCDVTNNQNQAQRIKHTGLPFQTLIWVTERSVVAAGHEYSPILFQNGANGFALVKNLDAKPAAAEAPAAKGAKVDAFAMFQNKVQVGSDTRTGEKMNSKHQNCITCMDVYQGQRGKEIGAFSTSGVDGRVVVWKVAEISKALSIKF